jgi:DUF971 family protein
MSVPPPIHLRVRKSEKILEVEWSSANVAKIPFKQLRTNCPCAMCVDELTGERILDPATVSEDIVPAKLEFTGNYAIKVTWPDGHSTGLYTWDLLDEIARCTKSS